MNMKKAIRNFGAMIVLAFVFAVLMPNVMPAHLGQVEAQAETAKASANKIMKAIQKCDNKNLNKYVKAKEKSGQETYKDTYRDLKGLVPAMYQYVKKNNGKMTYTIKSVKTKGKTATVKIRVRSVDSSEYSQAVKDAYSAQQDDIMGQLDTDKMQNMTFEEMLAYAVEKILGSLNTIFENENAVPRKTVYRKDTITLKLTKSGSRWVVKTVKENSRFAMLITANLGDMSEVTAMR